jgi:hypothetical protein
MALTHQGVRAKTMTTSWNETLAKLPVDEQAAIAKRSREVMAEYVGLKGLSKARRLSRAALAARLHTDQAGVSKLEKRANLLLSTLKGYVEAAGGSLEIVARFPDGPALRIDRLGQVGRPKKLMPHRTRLPLVAVCVEKVRLCELASEFVPFRRPRMTPVLPQLVAYHQGLTSISIGLDFRADWASISAPIHSKRLLQLGPI